MSIARIGKFFCKEVSKTVFHQPLDFVLKSISLFNENRLFSMAASALLFYGVKKVRDLLSDFSSIGSNINNMGQKISELTTDMGLLKNKKRLDEDA